ncbi:WD repeat-containing protein 97-like isoform X2 [Cephus cinctus]|uniref:WD repeat-containing protein 97-like isoform X2 n=1 Tax=Cephus cinctus TaxID=211228 RepID=A0AAJ7RLL7_CEPCN|nr:WD repeat-containing protein 97-like isoform X2 [Cephus cinctus]
MDDSENEKKKTWKVTVEKMRERLKNHIDENTFEGIREDKLYHGLKLSTSVTMLGKYIEICYCSESQEYLVLEPLQAVYRYSMQGRPILPSYTLSSTMGFTKMIWCDVARSLACYSTHDDLLWILTGTFVLYQIVRNEFRIENLAYEPLTNDLIVIGETKVTRYNLDHKEQTLNSWKTMCYVDSELGPLWKITCSSLIPQNTYKEDGAPAAFLERRSNATDATITGLLFHVTCHWIITGDQAGNVTGWNLKLECMMYCEAAHRGQVREIAAHPSICGFVTYADDDVFQVWSCNFRDKMETFTSFGEIRGIALNESAAAIATLGSKLNCFSMHQLYIFYAPLTHFATILHSTTHPMLPKRIVACSYDNIIRILSSPAGKQINVQILPKTLDVISTAYSYTTERLYTIILKTGEILVSSSKTYPMTFRYVWIDSGPAISCIVAYEHYEEIRDFDLKPQKPRVIHDICTIIIVGRVDGSLVVIDNTGKHDSTYRAHNGPVIQLWSSVSSRHIISVGSDRCVKIWHVFPDISQPLAVASSVYYTIPITNVVSMGNIVCMVSSTVRLKTHQLLMYDLTERIRLEHHSLKDHTKLIMAISSLDSLQICATSSMDNSIRIWDNQNNLLKILEINTKAYTITFSSLRGDIVFGAARHLYKIPYENYLSPKFRARIIINEIPEDPEEEELEENIEYVIYDNEVNRALALHPVSSTPLGSLDVRKGDVPRLDLMIQEHMCDQFRHRDEDIILIAQGLIKRNKLILNKAQMNRAVWDKYISDLLETSQTSSKDVTPHNIWGFMKKQSNVKKYHSKPGIFRMLYGRLFTLYRSIVNLLFYSNNYILLIGYSMERFSEYPDRIPDNVEHSDIPLFGFLPNSIVYTNVQEKVVKPTKSVEIVQKKIKYEYPPEFLASLMKDKESNETIVPLTLSQLVEFGENLTSMTVI